MHDPHFQFIHDRYPDLSEAEILEAEERFARLLDILSEVAAEEGRRAPPESSNPIGARHAPEESKMQNNGAEQRSFGF